MCICTTVYYALFVCYVGYEYAMCNFTPNKLCYVILFKSAFPNPNHVCLTC